MKVQIWWTDGFEGSKEEFLIRSEYKLQAWYFSDISIRISFLKSALMQSVIALKTQIGVDFPANWPNRFQIWVIYKTLVHAA